MESIHDDACKLVEAVEALEKETNTDPGYVLSFFVYPKAQASA